MSTVANARPARNPGITLRRSAGEIMLYDETADRVHMLNATAAAIWELCDGQTDEPEMVAAICQLTGLPVEVIEEDVSRLLAEFAKAGLVDLAPSDAPRPAL